MVYGLINIFCNKFLLVFKKLLKLIIIVDFVIKMIYFYLMYMYGFLVFLF